MNGVGCFSGLILTSLYPTNGNFSLMSQCS
jgi:hypothetical protein